VCSFLRKKHIPGASAGRVPVHLNTDIGVSVPNNQRQYRILHIQRDVLHIQRDVLPYALC